MACRSHSRSGIRWQRGPFSCVPPSGGVPRRLTSIPVRSVPPAGRRTVSRCSSLPGPDAIRGGTAQLFTIPWAASSVNRFPSRWPMKAPIPLNGSQIAYVPLRAPSRREAVPWRTDKLLSGLPGCRFRMRQGDSAQAIKTISIHVDRQESLLPVGPATGPITLFFVTEPTTKKWFQLIQNRDSTLRRLRGSRCHCLRAVRLAEPVRHQVGKTRTIASRQR